MVPNGVLAQMQFENMKERPKLLLQQNFSLRIETHVEQLRSYWKACKGYWTKTPRLNLEARDCG